MESSRKSRALTLAASSLTIGLKWCVHTQIAVTCASDVVYVYLSQVGVADSQTFGLDAGLTGPNAISQSKLAR